MTEELFDTSRFGSFYIPVKITEFLSKLAAPKMSEKILTIGFDPDELKETVLLKKSDVTSIKSRLSLGEFDQLQSEYDVIICAPTFGITIEDNISGYGETSEEFWIKWGLGHMSNQGRLLIFVPMGLLSNHSQLPIREFILNEGCIRAVIELPSGWARSTLVSASILYITRPPCIKDYVYMARLDDIEPKSLDSLLDTIGNNSLNHEIEKLYNISYSDLEQLRLDAQFYDPKYTEVPEIDAEKFREYKLGELVTIRSGERFSKQEIKSDGLPFIKVGNVTPEGNIDARNVLFIDNEAGKNSRGHAEPGDIILTIAGTVGKAALVDFSTPNGINIDTSLRRLQIKDQLLVLPEYLYLYLKSGYAQRQIERMISGSVINVLSSPNLETLVIHIPSLADQKQILAAFKNIMGEFNERILDKFPNISNMISASRLSLPIEGEKQKQLELNLEKGGEKQTNEIIQYEFPFPIARVYTVFVDKNLQYSERFRALIDISEAVVYFMHGILASDYIQRLQVLNEDIRTEFRNSISNYSLERRMDFVFAVLKLARQDTNIQLFIPESLDFELGICNDIHRNLRNKSAHRGGLTEAWYENQLTQYEEKISRLLNSLSPLKNYKLSLIKNLTIKNKRFLHTILSATGNNPMFQSQVEDLESPISVDTQHVVLIDQDFNALDLHPFYLFHAWESTGMQNHLCLLKQVMGEPPNIKLRIESTHGVGEIDLNTDYGLGLLI